MSDLIRCPNCGSLETALTDVSSKKYRCHACMSNFLLAEKKSNPKAGLATSPLSMPKSKEFFDKLMNKVEALNVNFGGIVCAGTGFFISKEYLLTNAHVVLNGEGNCNISDFAIKIAGTNYWHNKLFFFDIIAADIQRDIALLKAQREHDDFVTFSKNMYNGEPVYAIGNSRGEGLCILEGIISDVSRTVNSNKVFMTSALVTKGNSGCPVFNAQGLLLGMISEGSANSVAMNYGIPSSVLLEFIDKVEQSEEIKILER